MLALSSGLMISALHVAAVVGAVHHAFAGALNCARLHRATRDITVRPHRGIALLRAAAAIVTTCTADHGAGWHRGTFERAARTTRLRATVVHAVAFGVAIVSADRPAAIAEIVAGLIAAIAVAAEEALLSAGALAVVARATAIAGGAAEWKK